MRTMMMMGVVPMLVVCVGAPRAAYALTQNDTMTDWLHASDADRFRVLDDLQAKLSKLGQASRAKVVDCMNGAAEITGHGALRIGDVAEACAEPQSPANGNAPNDI